MKRSRSFVLLYSILGLTLIGIVFFSQFLENKPSLRPLATIAIPTRPTIFLPGPLELPLINADVLGSETVDPKDIISFINEQRLNYGSPPLREQALLTKAAQMRANVILKYQNFSHHDPHENIQLDTVLPIVGYPFIYATENIGMGDSTARTFVNGFMSSPSHKTNLLNRDLLETGVAVVSGPYKQYYVNIAVQLFAIPVTRDSWLGYTKKDIEDYKELLADVVKQLELTRELSAEGDNETYYEEWRRILTRQREILNLLVTTMNEEKPLLDDLVQLIREYNDNWGLVPQS